MRNIDIKTKIGLKALFLPLIVIGLIVAGATQGLASKTDLNVSKLGADKRVPILKLTRGFAEIIELEGSIADVMVADPSLIDVMALQSNRLYIVGVNYGSTNIIAVDERGDVISRLNVHVKIDETAIQNTVDTFFPDEDVTISAAADQIILSGHVSSPDAAQRISRLVANYVSEVQDIDGSTDELIENMMTVAGENQVMIRVKMIEASRNILTEFGIDPGVSNEGFGNFTGNLGIQNQAGLTADPFGIASLIYQTGSTGPLSLVINALEDTGYANTLAEPNLTAVSGEQAGFLAGGEFPVPTGTDDDGNILLEFRPFGVALNFRPVVLSNDRISLQLQTEVSSIAPENGFDQPGLSIPGFSTRRAETTVEIPSGGNIMIAGLLQSEVAKGLSELPGINDIPVLGKLAASESFQREETELVVIISAYLVKPYSNQADNKAKEIPKPVTRPLAKAFANNMRRTFSKASLSPEMFDYDGDYGYILN